MLPTFSAGFFLEDSSFGDTFPPQARALLDSEQVLAWRYSAKVSYQSWSFYPDVRIALPDSKHGVRWITTAEEILAAESQAPGLVYAALDLAQRLHHTFNLYDALQHWSRNHGNDDTSYAGVCITKDGYVIGEDDVHFVMEDDVDELIGALQDDDPNDPIFATFDMSRVVTIVLPKPKDTSAHSTLSLHERSKRTLAQWQRVDTTWGDYEATPTVIAPSIEAITQAMR